MSIASVKRFSGFPLPYPGRVTVETPDGECPGEEEKVPVIGAGRLGD